MNFSFASTKKSGRCIEVGTSGGSIVSNNFHLGTLKITIFWNFCRSLEKFAPTFSSFSPCLSLPSCPSNRQQEIVSIPKELIVLNNKIKCAPQSERARGP